MEPSVASFLKEYHYPGNIREMRNIIERLIVLSSTGKLMEKDLPAPKSNITGSVSFRSATEHETSAIPAIKKPLRIVRKEAESQHIQEILRQCDSNVAEAAKILEISHRQLNNKINEYGLRTFLGK